MCSPATNTCETTAVDPPDAPTTPTFSELSGKQWLMPCKAPPDPMFCDCDDATTKLTVGGLVTATYDVRVRIRGVMERGTYTGGTANGAWYVGGSPAGSVLTVAELRVSDPPQSYFLNNVPAQAGLPTLDYEASLPIRGGATVVMFISAQDGREITSPTAAVPGVVTTPSPYVGQFAQIDVVLVTPQ